MAPEGTQSSPLWVEVTDGTLPHHCLVLAPAPDPVAAAPVLELFYARLRGHPFTEWSQAPSTRLFTGTFTVYASPTVYKTLSCLWLPWILLQP